MSVSERNYEVVETKRFEADNLRSRILVLGLENAKFLILRSKKQIEGNL